MRIRFNIKKEIPVEPYVLENKINDYLKNNYYRVTERGDGFIYFTDDEFSNRKGSRSDYYSRINEGKFEFQSTSQGTIVKLTYFVPVLQEIIVIILFETIAIYAHSFLVVIPILIILNRVYIVYYLNEHVFKELMEC